MVQEEVEKKPTCHHKNKYDKLIEERLRSDNLSLPILKADNRYDNPTNFTTWSEPGYMLFAKWFLLEANESKIPKNKDELDKELPILKPDFSIRGSSSTSNDNTNGQFQVTWIGHATVLIQVDGLNILTDPIFSQRASPSQYFGPKRYRDAACDVASLPLIDYVLISHSHYDHLDADSVRDINNRFGSNCRWLVPLGLGSFLKSMSVENFVELNWWEKDCSHEKSFSTNLKEENKSSNKIDDSNHLAIYLSPNQHWSRRGAFDKNKSLWGSFTIVNKLGSTFFFAGDTGYCPAFKEIGEIFGPFSGAAIPIGAFKPKYIMAPAHVGPEEALQIHQDLKSFKSIAIHHATFNLSSEFYKEPATLLKELVKKDSHLKPFLCLKHGETIVC